MRRLQQKAESIPCRTVREKLLSAAGRIGPQDRRGLNAFLDAIEGQDLQDSGYANWVVLGNWCARLGRLDDAAHAYGVAVALAPREFWPRFNRGALFLVMNEHSRALEDFEHVLALRPDHPLAYLNRGLAKLGLGDAAGAVEDLTRCLGLKHAPTRAWFIRARAKARLGDAAGSAADRGEGLRRTPEDEESFVARGLARLPADPRGALVDFDAALGLNPRYVHALQDKASVLSENLGRPAEALEALGTALEHHPTFAPALAGRAVLHARLGRRAAAHSDIHAALDLDDRPTTAYQAACVFALTSKLEPADRADAFRLLSTAIRGDDSWLTVAIGDPDLAPLRDRPEFRELLQALTVVQRARASK